MNLRCTIDIYSSGTSSRRLMHMGSTRGAVDQEGLATHSAARTCNKLVCPMSILLEYRDQNLDLTIN
jgi:hypothetical protein